MELKIEARNVELRKSWQDKIEEEKEKIVRLYANYVLHLRASIEATTHHKEGGFEIKLIATVPNDTVVVVRRGESVRPLLIEAFDVLTGNLKEILRKKRKTVKQSEADFEGEKVGIIRKISPHESYGFITASDEREIYFHENALKNIAMEALSEGDSVVFGETIGDKGPQASWVRQTR
ncbi:HPF/RaiA family ribosome-associated protein [Desulfoprunum benzoelyticum]|uniref:Cold shock CspA family protein n=1 Tax=Desulfoprunum benzoelyticum TaxID=1506996 RepID=A0A840UZU0_9BACT|nr:cold shock domain-containing protein [Desulfoprunum benzoelyticum]MBB5348964.1 cold shock CspA family protein [Desulfoprunum benzoelyticum]MBM9530785.1 HPF/RaiA family ribosome-associated protein [Desulfoprunum benzoelyticum]